MITKKILFRVRTLFSLLHDSPESRGVFPNSFHVPNMNFHVVMKL